MPSHFYLIFNMPGQAGKLYFRREAEKLVAGRAVIVPEIISDVQQAHKFNTDSAKAFRDRYREEYRHENYEIFIQDVHGNKVFEVEAQPQHPSEDNRPDLFVIPDAYESSGFGFIVRAAVTPSLGRCYVLRACDVPSMGNRNVESIYAVDAVQAVQRAMLLWAPFIQPFEHPLKAQRDTTEAKKILQEIEKIKQGPGRRRPGND
jgi:hypothetical protein